MLHMYAKSQLLQNSPLSLYNLVLQVNVLLIQYQRYRFPGGFFKGGKQKKFSLKPFYKSRATMGIPQLWCLMGTA